MRPWTRWQDWVTLGAGVVAGSGGIMGMAHYPGAMSMVALGALMVVAALITLAVPDKVVMEYVKVALSMLLIISPWTLGFAGSGTTASVAWLMGVIAMAASLWAAPYSVDMWRHHHHPSGA